MQSRSLFRDISSVFGSNVMALASAFLIDIIISRSLGPEGRGLYTSILVVPLMVVSFAMLGIRRSAVFHLGQKQYDENRIVSGIFSLYMLTSLLALTATGLALFWTNPNGLTPLMVIIAMLAVPVKLFLAYAGGIYIGNEDFRRSNRQVWLPMFLNLVGVVLFLILLNWDVTGALLALFLSLFSVALFSLRYLLRHYKVKIFWDKEMIGSLAGMGFVYALALVVMQLNYRLDILLLQKLSDLKQVGYYGLGVAISDKLWQLPTAVGLVVMSRSANTTDEALLNREVAKLVRVSFLLILLAAMVLWFLAPYLIPWIFGEQFIPSVEIVRWMLPGIVIFVVVRVLSGRFSGSGQPQALIAIFLPALILNVILNLFWIPKYGGVGAAMATNVSYILGAIATLIVFSVKMKVSLSEIFLFQKSDFALFKRFLKRRKLS